MHQIVQICTNIFKRFPGVTLPDPITGEGAPQTLTSARVHRPAFLELPQPLIRGLHLSVFLSVSFSFTFSVWKRESDKLMPGQS